jgi:hypothetical protein
VRLDLAKKGRFLAGKMVKNEGFRGFIAVFQHFSPFFPVFPILLQYQSFFSISGHER